MLGYIVLCMSCSETEKQDVDVDKDGVFSQDDCDDSEPNIGTGIAFTIDTDGDGYGSLSQTDISRTLPQGFFCDDGKGDSNPSAIEVCDGADNDCNTSIPPDELDDNGYVECDFSSVIWTGSSSVVGGGIAMTPARSPMSGLLLWIPPVSV